MALDSGGKVYACGKSHNNVRCANAGTGIIAAFAGDPANRVVSGATAAE